jgi:hypothetical protein
MAVVESEIDVRIDMDNIYRIMGYDGRSEPNGRVSSLVEEYADQAYHLIEPGYTYVLRDVRQVRGSWVLMDGPVVFQSDVVAGLLQRCSQVAVFVSTIGKRLEDMARRLAEDGLMLQASVLDAIGSDAVTGVADAVQRRISEWAGRRRLVSSRRFSPGYCDWDVAQQVMVFRAINRDATDVRLTENFLMDPRKSISGIIGIGVREDGVSGYNPCVLCDASECPGRR